MEDEKDRQSRRWQANAQRRLETKGGDEDLTTQPGCGYLLPNI